jgi:superfamily I DNA and RNA helicase
MEFIPTLPSYASDLAAKTVWGWINDAFPDAEGVCFYKYPNVGGPYTPQPDLTIVTREHQPLVVRCMNLRAEQVKQITDDAWGVEEDGTLKMIDSPLLELEDIVVALQEKFDRERPLRKTFEVKHALAMPLVEKSAFKQSFGDIPATIFEAADVTNCLLPRQTPISDDQWRLAQSVIQAAVPLTRHTGPRLKMKVANFGEALRELENEIALLDMEQQRAAAQIPPGPQRIRGLAGTGKTVLLALKAANIHRQFPEAKILFTFNTQSLYNQSRSLISKFYRHFSGVEPDFDNRVHVRHAWGGRVRPGVYYEACKRASVEPLNFMTAKRRDQSEPFKICCEDLLTHDLSPFYDFVLMDEGQDFPKEFYRLIYAITKGDVTKSIYFAYDELQSLSAVKIPQASELFGSDANGNARVSLEGEYPGPIDKDFVLHKSYRCPMTVLMVAHAIGLGLYRPKGPIQMLADRSSWQSIGYEVVDGELRTGSGVTIERPKDNSPNRIAEIFPSADVFESRRFGTRGEELAYVAAEIQKNIQHDGIKPEEIVVISLDSVHAKNYMSHLQSELWSRQISSTIPGLVDDQAEFAEPGKVTLATVFRAKGNEAPMVYIVSFDSIFDYVEEIRNRNRAFTAISRSKAWVRISGIGPQMAAAEAEISAIRAKLPNFNFVFPDMKLIRKLDSTETTRRRREVKKAEGWAQSLTKMDVEAIRKLDPSLLQELIKKIETAANDTE